MLEISRLKDQGIPADKLADFDICEAAGQALLSAVSDSALRTVPKEHRGPLRANICKQVLIHLV